MLAVRVSHTDLPNLRRLSSVFLSSTINDLSNYAKLKLVRWPVSISVESQTDSVDDVLNDVYLKLLPSFFSFELPSFSGLSLCTARTTRGITSHRIAWRARAKKDLLCRSWDTTRSVACRSHTSQRAPANLFTHIVVPQNRSDFVSSTYGCSITLSHPSDSSQAPG